MTTGTELYERAMSFAYEDQERGDLMRKVWSVTPFMINCYTNNLGSERETAMRQWCYENIGPQAYPIHERNGDWQFGGATVFGWTWLGFSSADLLDKFLAAFPDAEKEPAE